MDFLYQQLIAGKQKAIAGWIAGASIVFLAQHGITLPASAKEVLTALLYGLIPLVSVYLKRNKV